MRSNRLRFLVRIDVDQMKIDALRLELLAELPDLRRHPIRDRAIGPDKDDDVDAAFAVPGRPAYRARGGYLGSELRLALSRRASDSLSWFVSVRAMSLSGAANSDSPLLLRSATLDVGAGLLWTPWRSRQRAPG